MKYRNVELDKDKFKKVNSDSNEPIKDVVEGESLSFFKDAWLRLLQNKAAIIGLSVIVLLILLAIFVPIFGENIDAQKESEYWNLPARIPLLEHLGIFNGHHEGIDVYAKRGLEDTYYWFGTDGLGRSQFVRTFYGVRISLFIAFLAAAIDMIVGVAYGSISGYFGKKVDLTMQRIIEVIAAIPSIVIATLLVVILEPGILPIALALMLTGWIGMSRVVRAQFIKNRNQEYVLAAKTLGADSKRVILKHLYPNIIGQVVVVTMFSIPGAIFYEAFLSYIGVGIVYPQTSLGQIISNAQSSFLNFGFQLFFPAMVLVLLMLSFNLLANGLRDALDPKLRGK